MIPEEKQHILAFDAASAEELAPCLITPWALSHVNQLLKQIILRPHSTILIGNKDRQFFFFSKEYLIEKKNQD